MAAGQRDGIVRGGDGGASEAEQQAHRAARNPEVLIGGTKKASYLDTRAIISAVFDRNSRS
ncbi:MAG: hypothetical protein ACREFZ_04685, partial [Acetobacteraceae bacterium]